MPSRSRGPLIGLAIVLGGLVVGGLWYRSTRIPDPVVAETQVVTVSTGDGSLTAPAVGPRVTLAPIAASAKPLASPETLIDPLAGTITVGEPVGHDHRPLLPPEVDEASAPTFFIGTWRDLSTRSPDDRRFRAESEEFVDLLGEAFARWPALTASAELQRMRLQAGERYRGAAGLGADVWTFALAVAGDKSDGAAALVAREIERVFANERDDLVVAYAHVLQEHAPDAAPLPRALITVAQAQMRLDDFPQARTAYLDAAKLGSGIVALDAWKGQLGLSMRWCWNDDTIDAAGAVLSHPDATDEDKALALYGRARAQIAKKNLLVGMKDCQLAAESYPATTFGRHAKSLYAETRAESMRELSR